jgi:hypothetical protein
MMIQWLHDQYPNKTFNVDFDVFGSMVSWLESHPLESVEDRMESRYMRFGWNIEELHVFDHVMISDPQGNTIQIEGEFCWLVLIYP